MTRRVRKAISSSHSSLITGEIHIVCDGEDEIWPY